MTSATAATALLKLHVNTSTMFYFFLQRFCGSSIEEPLRDEEKGRKGKGKEGKGRKGRKRENKKKKEGKVNEMRDENGKLKKQISGYGLILSRQMTQL